MKNRGSAEITEPQVIEPRIEHPPIVEPQTPIAGPPILDNESVAKTKSSTTANTGYIPMGENDVHPLLVHLKYKISNNYSNISKTINQLGEKSEQYQEYYHKLDKAIHSKTITKERQLKAIAKLNIFLLECLKYDKKKLLKKDFAEEALVNHNWLNFQNSVSDPIYAFQDLYFDFIHNKSLVNHFGEDLSIVVEEVLRDDIISENEKYYLFEKAEEHGIPHVSMEGLLKDYFQTNPALKKLIYEICKDGKITEAEKNYLLEKTSQYKISDDKIITEIESILNTINKIRTLFANEHFYNLVILLYIGKFLDPFDSASIEIVSQQIEKEDSLLSHEFLFNTIEEIQPRLTELIYIASDEGVAKNTITNIQDIIKHLGIKIRLHTSIQHDLKAEPCELSIEELSELFSKSNKKSDSVDESDNKYKFGSSIFAFNYVEDPNYPLFCYDSLGEKVVISINKSHYFYNESEAFKIWLISMVINLKKNYANEQLIEDIQHLFNPSAAIRLKFPKKDLV